MKKVYFNHTVKTGLKIVSVILILVMLAIIVVYIASLFMDENSITAFFQEWADENTAVCIVLFLICAPLINIIPGVSSMFFISLANLLFNDQTTAGCFTAFGVCGASVLLTSSLMFMIGRWGGKRLLRWIVDKKDIDESMRLLTLGGKAVLPAAFLLPGFPDDTLSLVAGMTNISFLYNFVCTLIFREIGVFSICFIGTDYLDYSSFTWYEWIIFIALIIAVLAVLAFISYKYFIHLRHKEEGDAFFLKYRLKVKSYSVRKAEEEDIYTLRKIMKKSKETFDLPLKKMKLDEIYDLVQNQSVYIVMANSSEKAFYTVSEENGMKFIKDVYYTDEKALVNMLAIEKKQAKEAFRFGIYTENEELKEQLSLL